jgi:hypothetical protein
LRRGQTARLYIYITSTPPLYETKRETKIQDKYDQSLISEI